MPKVQQKTVPAKLTGEVGRSGLRHSGGQILAEFDADLRGIRGVRTYEEMRRNDPTVALGLRLINWVLGQVQWHVEPGGDTPADLEAAGLVDSAMQDMSITWTKFVRDALTCLPFGWAYLEGVYKVRNGPEGDPPSRFDDGRIAWRKWNLIGQESLSHWDFDDNGGIRGMVQVGDVVGSHYVADTLIPIEKALLFRLEDEKNNPEGVSILRSIYLPWHIKKNLQEIEAIGIERDLTGVLIIHLPVNATQTDKDKAINLLEQFKADDMAGFTAPQFGPGEHERWRFEIINSPGSKSIDSDKVISRYQYEIARNFLAQFLLLGQGETGSRSVGITQKDMFEVALGAIMQNFEETINRFMVPPLFRLNTFGQLTALPQIKAGRVSKGDMEKFSTALKNLTDSGLLTPNRDTEQFLRNEMELPELPEEEKQEAPTEETGQDKQSKEFAEDDEDVPLPDPEDDEAWRQIEEEAQRIIEKPGRRRASSELFAFARPYAYGKKLDEIAGALEDRLAQLAEDLREKRITQAKWSIDSRRAMVGYNVAGYQLGVAQSQGIAPSKVKLSVAQRNMANELLADQYKYFAEFSKKVKGQLAAGEDLTTALDARAKMYAGSVRAAVSKARIDAESERKLKWVRFEGDSCDTCLKHGGEVKTAKQWKEADVWPSHNVTCLSNCRCTWEEVK